MSYPFVPAHGSNFRVGRGGQSIRYIVMHYTANDGDTDEGNANYFRGANRGASAHYFVDEDSITQTVRDEDTAWHCGGSIESSHHPYRGICTNSNSIGIELCSDKAGGKFTLTEPTIQRAAPLVRALMKRYNIPIDRVIRHYDVTGKYCPEPWVRKEDDWQRFLRLVRREEETELTADEIKKLVREEIRAYEKEKTGETPSAWARSAWEAAQAQGITDGTNPQAPLTREQGIVMMQRAGLIGR